MPLIFHKKEKYVIAHIKNHVDLVVETVKVFINALYFYLNGKKDLSRKYTNKRKGYIQWKIMVMGSLHI